MSDEKRVTETTEVKTETKVRPGSPQREEGEYEETTTVKTEREVEKDDTVTIINE